MRRSDVNQNRESFRTVLNKIENRATLKTKRYEFSMCERRNCMTKGLVLEGGGARGAYQMGAVEAFFENGYAFGGVTGSSIGALNGGLIAQGDWEKCRDWWEKLSLSKLFDVDETILHDILYRKFDFKKISPMRTALHTFFEKKGLDTTKIREILTEIYDEQKLRESPTEFGIVTLKMPDVKPMELFKEDIPEGKLIEYLMASANMPVFKLEPISGEIYIDGGFYNNLPVNMLYRKGFRDVLVIRTYAIGVVKKFRKSDLRVTELGPSEDLGNILDFSHERIMRSMKVGRCDALRMVKEYAGKTYYLQNPPEEKAFFALFAALKQKEIKSIADLMTLYEGEPKRLLFEKILPAAARECGLSPSVGYREIALAILERRAKACGIERLQIFDYPDFVKTLKETPIPSKEDSIAEIIGEHVKRVGLGLSPQAFDLLADSLIKLM